MLSGDQAACEELLEIQPKAETVAVKQLAGKGSSMSLSHEEAGTQIRLHARRAVQRIKEFSPWIVECPVEMKFEYVPGTTSRGEHRQPPPRVYRGRTVLEAYQEWLAR